MNSRNSDTLAIESTLDEAAHSPHRDLKSESAYAPRGTPRKRTHFRKNLSARRTKPTKSRSLKSHIPKAYYDKLRRTLHPARKAMVRSNMSAAKMYTAIRRTLRD